MGSPSSNSPPETRPSAASRKGGGPVLWLLTWATAVACTVLPLLFWGLVITVTVGCLWHGHRLVMSMVVEADKWWRDVVAVLAMLLEGWVCLLLVRQLLTPAKKEQAWQEVLPGDQPHLYRAVKWVCEVIRAPMPKTIAVDSSAMMRAETQYIWHAIAGRGGHLQIGLSMPVEMDSGPFLGLLAHELSFLRRGVGAGGSRLIRSIEEWFVLRLKHDPWQFKFKKAFLNKHTGKRQKVLMLFCWMSVWLASRPLRLLYACHQILAAPAMRAQVRAADRCGVAIAGAAGYAKALRQRARSQLAWRKLEAELEEDRETGRLPDNIPLLLARQAQCTEPEELPETAVTHWLPGALPDASRIERAAASKITEPLWKEDGSATQLLVNYYELSRRATYFHYQNDWGLVLSHLKFITVEESISESRESVEIVSALNRYFKGMAHPERAFCGIAEENEAPQDSELLMMELLDCRDWLMTYGDRMSTALAEWSKTWALVRDLEAALALTKAGLHIQRNQYSGDSPDELGEEIERQRAAMDNMEGLLRQFEGRLETRMACCLELLAREPEEKLPPKLAEMRRTLPHWVLVYEALGLHLPVLRELMTAFTAFNALGATVSGTVESASYVTTVQHLIPKVTMHVRDIAKTLAQWPYPFASEQQPGVSLTMASYLSQRLEELDIIDPPGGSLMIVGDRRLMAQQAARKLTDIVGPFIDRYLALYHQAFAWVSKATQMAEWQFVDPIQEMATREARRAAEAKEEYVPPKAMAPARAPEDPELTMHPHESLAA